ncbi:hypothetical protein Tco_0527863 [Tanacetum coccineum]
MPGVPLPNPAGSRGRMVHNTDELMAEVFHPTTTHLDFLTSISDQGFGVARGDWLPRVACYLREGARVDASLDPFMWLIDLSTTMVFEMSRPSESTFDASAIFLGIGYRRLAELAVTDTIWTSVVILKLRIIMIGCIGLGTKDGNFWGILVVRVVTIAI